MPTFEYHAIRAEGDEEKSFVGGVVIAKDRHDAKAKLMEKGLKATMLKQARGVMAVIKWKKLCGFYVDDDREHDSTYTTNTNLLTSDVTR